MFKYCYPFPWPGDPGHGEKPSAFIQKYCDEVGAKVIEWRGSMLGECILFTTDKKLNHDNIFRER